MAGEIALVGAFALMNNVSSSRLRLLGSGFFTAVLIGLSGCGKSDPAASTPTSSSTSPMSDSSAAVLASTDQRVSYGIALNLGSNIARQGGVEIDTVAFLAGLQDGLSGAEPRVSQEDLQVAFQAAQAKAEQAASAGSAAIIAAGEQFLATNKTRAGVVTTPSGLQYEVLTAGTGPKPSANQIVEVHYHGTLIDGTVFDSSVQRGETIEFPVTGVIPGWVEALQLMSVGSKWTLFIPPISPTAIAPRVRFRPARRSYLRSS